MLTVLVVLAGTAFTFGLVQAVASEIPQLDPAAERSEVDGVVYYDVRDLMVMLITIPVLLALTWLVQKTKAVVAGRLTLSDGGRARAGRRARRTAPAR